MQSNRGAGKRVLMIGLHADSVDFDKWPELTREALEEAGRGVFREMVDAGFQPISCLVSSDGSAGAQVRAALDKDVPDVVLIGAGVRKDPDHLLLFEELLNMIQEHAPGARLAFNSLPHDSVEAVRRWA